jgi:hypothetical protein
MVDKAKPSMPDRDDTQDPKAPKPEKDEQRMRDTSRPMHPQERNKDRDT